MKTVRRHKAAWLAPMLLPALSGCGAAASVGPTLYSTSEAIATAVNDAFRQREDSPEGRAARDLE